MARYSVHIHLDDNDTVTAGRRDGTSWLDIGDAGIFLPHGKEGEMIDKIRRALDQAEAALL